MSSPPPPPHPPHPPPQENSMPPNRSTDGSNGSPPDPPAASTTSAPTALNANASSSTDNSSHNPIATQSASLPLPTSSSPTSSAPATTSQAPSGSSPSASASPLPNPGPLPATPQNGGTPSGASPRPSSNPAPGTPNPVPRRNQRPLSSVSFFVPFAGQQGGDGPQVGLTWTLEVFGDEADANTSVGMPPAAVPPAEGGNNEAAPPAEGEQPPAPAEATPAEAAPAGGQANPNPNPQGNGDRTRSIFFIVGADGTMRRGDGTNVDNAAAAPPPFPFAFPFPFPFAPGPPPPDPAKAAELLASLPTVGRALLKRVDKIVAAEDEDSSGWQCGVCLEGIDLGEPVKALPCNHLFHGSCLQPWFTNHHHTCPTCRLDLDPLRTLHEPGRRAPLRPGTTGSGRGTPAGRVPHPYTRPGNGEGRRTRPGSTVPGSDTPTQPGTPQNEPAADAGAGGPERLEVPTNPLDAMFDLARMFGMTASPVPMREGEQRQATANEGDQATDAPASNAPAGPSTQAGEAGEGAAAGSAPATGGGGPPPPRPSPERRRHITIFHIDNNGIHQHRHEHGHEHHAPRDTTPGAPAASAAEGAGATREGTPAAASDTPAAGGPGAPPAPPPESLGGGLFAFPRGQPTGPNHDGGAVPFLPRPNGEGGGLPVPVPGIPPFHFPTFTFDFTGGDNAAAPPAPAADTPNAGEAEPTGADDPPANGAPRPANTATFNFPFELLFMRPPGAGGPPGAGQPTPPENQAPPERTFVPQSLESWTAQREKTLGWRCDAVECQIAPPVLDPESMDVDVDEAEEPDDATAADKEMLAIYSEHQAPFPPRSGIETEPHTGQEFVLIACSHRWHRACLETAARSAGHSTAPDASGREWIRCARCRKEGWIVPRESERQEGQPQTMELAQ